MFRQTFNRPLALLVALGLIVYATIALEIYVLVLGAWSGMFLLLAIVVATAVCLALGVSHLLEEAGSPAEPAVRKAPEPELAPAPKRAPSPRPVAHVGV